MDINIPPALFSVFAGLLVVVLLQKLASNMDDVSSLQGPKSQSWVFGNMVDLVLGLPAGKITLAWFAEYGDVVRFWSCFGEEQLFVRDPVAIKHILSDPEVFAKSPEHQFINLVAFGPGSIFYVEGDAHRRIRAVTNPMFSASSVRTLIPILEKNAQNLSEDWTPLSGSVIDVCRPIHATTLRAITEAVMGYDTASDDEYTSAYEDLVLTMAQRSKTGILFAGILSKLPGFVIRWLKDHPPEAMQKALSHRVITRAISKRLLQKRRELSQSSGEPDADLFNILINTNDKSPYKMNEDDLHDQFGAITVAGEDTTANTLLWLLYSLAQYPDWQAKIRIEIMEASNKDSGKNLDYDRLPVLNAVVKETMRFYTTVPFTGRIACMDTVVPLSTPVVTSSGKTITEIRVKKGRMSVISITGYNSVSNRLPSLWGDDADEFKPSRWLDGRDLATEGSIGPYANLLSFLGGPRACLGWRYAILETQVIASELVKKFSFSLAENVTIQPAAAISLVPMDGEGKMRLPLRIERLQ
ncbi:cytochrome P450 [Pholiota molesta]|nr:cytochrome P450 [Pholiota molesta]